MPIKDGVIVIDNYLTYLDKDIRTSIFDYAMQSWGYTFKIFKISYKFFDF